MPLSDYPIRGIVAGALGLSLLIYYYWWRKPKREVTREELFRDFDLALPNYSTHIKRMTNMASIAVGRSEATTTSHSSMHSTKRDSTRESVEYNGMSYGKLGLKSLDEVINNLESCIFELSRYEEEQNEVLSQFPMEDSRLLFDDIRNLLENAILIRDKYKQKLIYTEDYIDSDDESSNDSFVSAMEYHIESNIENIIQESIREKRYLYKAALMELENGNIYYRSKRTELVQCNNDTDFIAKLHCLRLGFQVIAEHQEWIKEIEDFGLNICSKLLNLLDYEIDNFQSAYGRLIQFLHSPEAIENIRSELGDKGVQIVTLYDVLFDFLLFDALEVLENPPGSIVSVIRNRWLSPNFKKTALGSSVWTILLAKRKFLTNPQGFKAHMYDVFDTIGAPLAWAFLGPDDHALSVGTIIRESLLNLASQIYSDVAVRWTNENELAEDVMHAMRECYNCTINDLRNVISAE